MQNGRLTLTTMTMQSVKMGFVEAVKTCFSKAFTFTGRARRSEYWYWYLFSVIVSMPLSIILEIIPEDDWILAIIVALVASGWNFFNMIATLSVAIRRLHDTGRSGWWYGVSMILAFVWAMLVVVGIVVFAVSMIDDTSASMMEALTPFLVVLLVTYIPLLAYSIVLLVWLCQDSTPGPNKYGENPKGVGNADEALTPSGEMETEVMNDLEDVE